MNQTERQLGEDKREIANYDERADWLTAVAGFVCLLLAILLVCWMVANG